MCVGFVFWFVDVEIGDSGCVEYLEIVYVFGIEVDLCVFCGGCDEEDGLVCDEGMMVVGECGEEFYGVVFVDVMRYGLYFCFMVMLINY